MVAVAEKQEHVKQIEVQLIGLKLQLRTLETEISDLDQRKVVINQAALAKAKRISPEQAAAIIEKARRDVGDILNRIQEKRVEIQELKEIIASKEAERKKLLSAWF